MVALRRTSGRLQLPLQMLFERRSSDQPSAPGALAGNLTGRPGDTVDASCGEGRPRAVTFTVLNGRSRITAGSAVVLEQPRGVVPAAALSALPTLILSGSPPLSADPHGCGGREAGRHSVSEHTGQADITDALDAT